MEKQTEEKIDIKKLLAKTFPLTLPVLTGYIFMGMAFGILLQSKGYNALWALGMSVFIYAGSAQFLAVGLLASSFDALSAFLLILIVNARHIFYGISMLETMKNFGKARWYLAFALTDETFAMLVANKPPDGIPKKAFYLAVSIMNQLYWVVGCVSGALLGQTLPINTKGIDFVMTALFMVIFLEQWKNKSARIPAVLGLLIPLICRIFLGAQWFLPAAMAVMVAAILVLRKPLERSLAK